MVKIKAVASREILDSRGNPTVETKIVLTGDQTVVASVPSGASMGKYEAVELRDNDPNHYQGMGVLKAVANVNQFLAPRVVGLDVLRQKEIDQILVEIDGTENKSKAGANAILSVSLAVCKAGALTKNLPVYRWVAELFGLEKNLRIPRPVFNLINGGKHGAGNLDFQEFHIIPSGQMRYFQALETGSEIYQTVKKILIRHRAIHSVGDEGGFAPNLFSNLDALEVLVDAIKESDHELEKDVSLSLDVAASNFFEAGKYKIRDRTSPMDTGEMVDFYRDLTTQYPLELIEDPFHEDDWSGWQKVMVELAPSILVGDDLLATNRNRLEKAIQMKACSGALIKPNQIGTVSETMEVIKMARQAGLKVIVSHRSGETVDDFIADFAVGVGADYAKFGAPARGERVAKYNRLLEIEKEIGESGNIEPAV